MLKLLLDKIPQKAWIILFCFTGLSFSILTVCVGLLIIRSSNFSYSSGETNINIDTKKVKQASNDAEYTVKVLDEKLNRISDKIEQLENFNDPEVQEFVESVKEIEPVVEELERNNEELIEAVENSNQ